MKTDITPFSNIEISDIAEILKKNDSFILLSHTNPDPDTLGSTLALCEILRVLGKRALCLSDKALPKYVSFLDTDACVISDCTRREGDTVISVDVASPHMLGGLRDRFELCTDLRIDHHAQCTNFGKKYYNDPSASATGEIIYRVARELGIMNPRIADCLFAAVAGDTGCFRFSNTSAETHRIAAELIDAGANANMIYRALFESKERSAVLANALASLSIEYLFGTEIAFVMITNALKRERSLTDSDFEEVSSLLRSIEGVKLGIILKQLDGSENTFKASLRSEGNIDSSKICALLGGGGHMYAAGASINAESPDKAKQIVIGALEEYLKTL